ncbi:MAG: GNAT family N-acetyltransferase [Candidatus Micrarchaeota archaeon]|nr:GNAT family N-acetyltransferase [Candidatus Micrarchaeota archaeon]
MRIAAKGSGVYLKSLAVEDAEAIRDNADDRELARDVASTGRFPSPYTLADAHEFIQAAVGLYVLGTDMHMGVWVSEPERMLVGACALTGIDVKSRRAELSYWIGRRHWGRGIGKAAAAAMISYAFGELGLNRVYCHVFESNQRSISLLRSLGFVEEGRLRSHDMVDGKFVDTLVFGLLASEWEKGEIELSD